LGYELINEEYIGIFSNLVLIDTVGYFYFTNYHNLKYGSIPERFVKGNPYTIQNIKLWCKLNNKSYKLLSDTYEGNNKNLKWKCLKEDCGEEFESNWNNILSGRGCGFCVGRQVGLSNCLATKNPELAKEWHPTKNGNLTPYDVTINTNKKVYWECLDCGCEWSAWIADRNKGNGCPECNKSKGEKRISKYLDKHNILYTPQYKFDDLKGNTNKKHLKFDFAIHNINSEIIYLIEYDGEFHFKPARFSKDKKKMLDKLKKIQIYDIKKNLYCAKNDIQLIRIPYWEFNNIEKYLDYYFKFQR